jgi:hypothetical protein
MTVTPFVAFDFPSGGTAARDFGAMGLCFVSFMIRSFSQNDPIMAGTAKPPISAIT